MRGFLRLLIVVALLFPVAGAALAQTVTCSSDDGEKHYCAADTRYGAKLVRQSSKAPCTEGMTWGYDEEGIWVNKGCGGEFALGKGQEVVEATSGATITCSSEAGARKYCPIPTRGGVQLVKQRSDTACVQGTNWGYDDKGIWVNKGCGADFVVGVPQHPQHPVTASAPVRNERVSCTSDDGRRNYCDMELQGADVRLARQLSPEPCQEGSTWGHDGHGIWVDRGCRGEFLVTGVPGEGEKSCSASAGKKRAKELVEQCKQVSPGTHAGCNAKSMCEVIEDEIRRGCNRLGVGAPAFCADYK
jgi:Protein of unknown function (DUF3011)